MLREPSIVVWFSPIDRLGYSAYRQPYIWNLCRVAVDGRNLGIAGRTLGVRAQTRAEFTGFDLHESQDWDIMSFKMNSQFEALGKKRLHHQAHLVFAGIGHGRFGFDGEQIGSGPLWKVVKNRLTLERQRA